MRRIAAIVFVLLALVVWITLQATRNGDEVDALPDKAALAPTTRVVDPKLPTERSVELASPGHSSDLDERATALPPPSPAADSTRCIVFGRAVDESGKGLRDVTVLLAAYPRWSETAEVPILPGKWESQGYEIRTDENGVFRVEAPMPTAPVVFRLKPDDYHDRVWHRYGGAQSSDLPPLRSGENDLGTFMLASTGALSGFVRDDHGAPIAGARVRLGPSPSQTEEREAETDASGRYVIGHASEGGHGVNAEAKGYLSKFVKPFEVRRNETTPGPDFDLVAAPVLRGRIVNEEGQPLSGARLWGWPSSSGAGAGGTSEADGSFVVYLPQDEPYSMEVKLKGYEPFGEHDRKTLYKPGTEDIVCVLKREATTTFVVLDAESGEPVPRFDIRIERNKGSASPEKVYSWSEWVPQLRDHPGGEMTIGARPGIDRFEIAAADHERQDGDVKHESPTSPRHVIRLGRGTTLVGRVIRGGAPVADAGVKVERGTLDSDKEVDQLLSFRAISGEAHFGTTDSGGQLRVTGLDRGIHRVTISSSSGPSLVLGPVTIGRKAIHDLGTLEMHAGGTIRGSVHIQSGRSPAGLQVYLDEERGGRTTSVDANGRFLFEDVSPGMHRVNVKDLPGILAYGPPFPVEVTSGQEEEIILDLSSRGMCSVAVRVLIDGRPTQNVDVKWDPSDETTLTESLGGTDGEGWVRSSLPTAVEGRLIILASDGSPLSEDQRATTLSSGGSVERIFELTAGSLEIEWPMEAAVPAGSPLIVFLSQVSTTEDLPPFLVRASAASTSEGKTTNRCTLPSVGPGEYEVEIHPNQKEPFGERTPYVGRVGVRAGSPARVLVTRAD